tara:strand:- start:3630 stop:4244 length:615 start_codon:yes stop_codon:yes gene_type:complete
MVKENPNYYAIIPAFVRYSNIKANAKLLYGEISALSNKSGYCFATNRYFANLYGVSKNTISVWIKELKEHEFITVKIVRNENKEIVKRLIGITKNDDTPINENLKENTTSYITTRININNRKIKFNEIVFSVTDVSKDILKEFVNYWTEENRSGSKMLFELQPTFDINRRLQTWCRNEKKWSKGKASKFSKQLTELEKAKKLLK